MLLLALLAGHLLDYLYSLTSLGSLVVSLLWYTGFWKTDSSIRERLHMTLRVCTFARNYPTLSGSYIEKS